MVAVTLAGSATLGAEADSRSAKASHPRAVHQVSAPDNATPVSNSFRFTATGSTVCNFGVCSAPLDERSLAHSPLAHRAVACTQSPILSDAFERYLAILKPQQRATDHTVSAEAQLLELKGEPCSGPTYLVSRSPCVDAKPPGTVPPPCRAPVLRRTHCLCTRGASCQSHLIAVAAHRLPTTQWPSSRPTPP